MQLPWVILTILFLIIAIYYLFRYWIEQKLKLGIRLICEVDYHLPSSLDIHYSPDYNQATAYQLMCLNVETTLSSGCGKVFPSPNGFGEPEILMGYSQGKNLTAFARWYKNNDLAILSFSGTITLSEWYDDFSFKQVPPEKLTDYHPGQLIHEGFYDIYISLQSEIRKRVNNLQVPLIITGHSLGGALATICAVDLSFISNAVVYTFASPRVGNVEWAALLNHPRVFRIFNTEDMIPTLPLPVLGQVIYSQYGTLASNRVFTLNLGEYSKNHTQAYLQYLQS